VSTRLKVTAVVTLVALSSFLTVYLMSV